MEKSMIKNKILKVVKNSRDNNIKILNQFKYPKIYSWNVKL